MSVCGHNARWSAGAGPTAAGLITREQALRAGLSSSAITSKVVHGRWTEGHRGIYATFTGPLNQDVRLWAAVLYAGPGARLSHQTAATLIRLADRPSPLIHVAIPATRRVRPPYGVVIHISSRENSGWRFARGVPPHTLAEETSLIWCTRRRTSMALSRGDRGLREGPDQRGASAAGGSRAQEAQLARALHVHRSRRCGRRAGPRLQSPPGSTATWSKLTGSPPASKQARFTKPDGQPGPSRTATTSSTA